MSTQAIAAVGLYAALNGIILIWLILATSRLRRRHKVSVGDGGVPQLLRVMRGHANAAENMPMTMLLLLVAALMATPLGIIHALGAMFTLGRAIHAWHFIAERHAPWQRMAGFGLSMLATLLLAAGLLAHALAVSI